MRHQHSTLSLCEALEVSPSGYYDWQERRLCPGPRAQENQALTKEIKQLHKDSRKTYGSPRILAELRKKGARHGRARVCRIMQQEGLYGRQKGRYHVQTTDSNHDQPIALISWPRCPRPPPPTRSGWPMSTYIKTPEGWLFLAAILDLYSRRIVGWAMSQRNDTTLVLGALAMALLHRCPPAKLLFHTDRGVQYASGDYRRALAQAGLVASMSRKANCYDNAAMESFWSTLKLELIYRRDFASHSQARNEIFDFIEAF